MTLKVKTIIRANKKWSGTDIAEKKKFFLFISFNDAGNQRRIQDPVKHLRK